MSLRQEGDAELKGQHHWQEPSDESTGKADVDSELSVPLLRVDVPIVDH